MPRCAANPDTLQREDQPPGAANGDIPDTEEDVRKAKALNRKIDAALLPFLSLLYLFNGLDRSNIGNAETQGMNTIMEGGPC
jgi:hypothetical protein